MYTILLLYFGALTLLAIAVIILLIYVCLPCNCCGRQSALSSDSPEPQASFQTRPGTHFDFVKPVRLIYIMVKRRCC